MKTLWHVTPEDFASLDSDEIDTVAATMCNGVAVEYAVVLKEFVQPVAVEPIAVVDSFSSMWKELAGDTLTEDEARARLVEIHPIMPASDFRDRLDILFLTEIETVSAPVEQVIVEEVSEMNAPMTRTEIDAAKAEVETFRVEMNALEDELVAGIPCFLCGRGFEPDPAQYQQWGNSGLPWEPSEWECPDCIELMNVANAASLQAYQEKLEAENDAAQAERDRLVEAAKVDDSIPLYELKTKWWTPASVAMALGIVHDPADPKRSIVKLPFGDLTFIFRSGSHEQRMKTFNPDKWLSSGWEVSVRPA